MTGHRVEVQALPGDNSNWGAARTAGDAVRWATARLATTPGPRLEAEVLVAHVMGCDRATLFAWPERALSQLERDRLATLIERRAQGEPSAHLVGQCEFWSLTLSASPNALIPRADTELLVTLALDLARGAPAGRMLDLGTGSGAIALAFASECPAWTVVATDISPAALEQARLDADKLGIGNVDFRHADWLAGVGGSAAGETRSPEFDLIISNPPYIAEDDPHLSDEVRRFEPVNALFAGSDGLDAIRTIINDAPKHLRPGGWLILEHGFQQSAPVSELLQLGGFVDISNHRDLAGHPRAVRARSAAC